MDQKLQRRIRAIHSHSRGTYGAPRIHAQLKREGIHVGRKRVARLMRAEGLQGASRRRFVVTTRRGKERPAPDLVQRDFSASGPDRLWVADITTSRRPGGSCTSRSSSTRGADAWSAGRCGLT